MREELWKLIKEKTTTSSINHVYSAAYYNNESEDKVEISSSTNDKGRISGGKKDQYICFVEVQVLQLRREKRKANIKEACDKFKCMSSSIYCLILVQSWLVIQPCKIEEFSSYD